MIWSDFYNSVPTDKASVLTMVVGKDGSRCYAVGMVHSGDCWYVAKNGEVEHFPLDSVRGKEHIYYIVLDEIMVVPEPALN